MADKKLTALDDLASPADSDILYVVAAPGTTPVEKKATIANVIAAGVQASQLVNEIKGWPPIVNTGDLDALNLWWDKVGTPSTAPSVVAGNDGSITFNYSLVLKVVADGSGEGLSQTWTYADEPRVKAGRVLSTLWAIWCVSGVGVTASLVNSDASNTAAAKVTAAAWTIVEVPNHTLAGTSCSVQLVTDGAGTFYAVPLGANIGTRGFPLRPRGLRYLDAGTEVTLVNNADPGAAWVDVDCTANTSPLAVRACIYGIYSSGTAAFKDLRARRNGDTATGVYGAITRAVASATQYVGRREVPLDDGNIFEYTASDVAANAESVYIFLDGWWEWE